MQCPVCSNRDLEPYVSSEVIEEEFCLRFEFWAARIDGPPKRPDMKDRTDVLHATSVELRICRPCGVLVRESDCRDFADEEYAPWVMEKILRSNIDAFRMKEPIYRPLLPAAATVIEVGSFVGGFLHVASEWGWTATGIDVGKDTAHFSASHGYPTIRKPLEECGLAPESFDGTFVWNTFEQLEQPAAFLTEANRITREGGILVLRTPNALFYAACEAMLQRLRSERPPTHHDPIVRLLAWNNLLGFPHRFGFTARSLDSFVASHGFEPAAHHGDTVISPSEARLMATARRDENDINVAILEVQSAVASIDPSLVVAPWFEAVYRKERSS